MNLRRARVCADVAGDLVMRQPSACRGVGYAGEDAAVQVIGLLGESERVGR